VVDDHGGTIAASNRPEGGACFRLEFPIGRQEEARRLSA
jgi:signal transduction histidine kinase